MRINKKPVKTLGLVNVSLHRNVLAETGDLLSALIVEFIYFRYNLNDKKPVWLKLDWIHDKMPSISRSGLAKKLKKLVKDRHIIEKKGKGKHYHKCWYSPSTDMIAACSDTAIDHMGKVYYNLEIAKENPEASVIYATIINLLKVGEDPGKKVRGVKSKVGWQLGRVEDKLLLDYEKLVDGSGLSLRKVRKAVKWLIDNKKIESKRTFGNKLLVWMPAETIVKPGDLEDYFNTDLPTESYPNEDPDELPTESYPHG